MSNYVHIFNHNRDSHYLRGAHLDLDGCFIESKRLLVRKEVALEIDQRYFFYWPFEVNVEKSIARARCGVIKPHVNDVAGLIF